MRTLFRAGRLVDGTGAAPIDDAAVVVEGGRVAFVGPEAEARATHPTVAGEVDARDGVVVPGLIDGHCHMVGTWPTLDPQQPGHRERAVLRGVGAAQQILAADPGEDPAAFDQVRLVVKGGRVAAAEGKLGL